MLKFLIAVTGNSNRAVGVGLSSVWKRRGVTTATRGDVGSYFGSNPPSKHARNLEHKFFLRCIDTIVPLLLFPCRERENATCAFLCIRLHAR